MESSLIDTTISKDDMSFDFFHDPLSPYYLHQNEYPWIVLVSFKLIMPFKYVNISISKSTVYE